jgi:hypothetical protein
MNTTAAVTGTQVYQVLADSRGRPGPGHGPRDVDRAGVQGADHQAGVGGQLLRLRPGRDGQIIERVQQAGVLGQMRQLCGKALGLVGLDAMLLWP